MEILKIRTISSDDLGLDFLDRFPKWKTTSLEKIVSFSKELNTIVQDFNHLGNVLREISLDYTEFSTSDLVEVMKNPLILGKAFPVMKCKKYLNGILSKTLLVYLVCVEYPLHPLSKKYLSLSQKWSVDLIGAAKMFDNKLRFSSSVYRRFGKKVECSRFIDYIEGENLDISLIEKPGICLLFVSPGEYGVFELFPL